MISSVKGRNLASKASLMSLTKIWNRKRPRVALGEYPKYLEYTTKLTKYTMRSEREELCLTVTTRVRAVQDRSNEAML